MLRSMLAVVLATASCIATAQMTPVGLWKTIDDDGKTEKSLVRISDKGGVLSGVIDKIFDPAKQDSKCDLCSDERKDKPVLGMEIVRDARKSDGRDVWQGGHILDPNSGKVYKLKMTPIEDGKKLEVRGFIGFALLGRTQTWVRTQ